VACCMWANMVMPPCSRRSARVVLRRGIEDEPTLPLPHASTATTRRATSSADRSPPRRSTLEARATERSAAVAHAVAPPPSPRTPHATRDQVLLPRAKPKQQPRARVRPQSFRNGEARLRSRVP
jgi:hypothetical protein